MNQRTVAKSYFFIIRDQTELNLMGWEWDGICEFADANGAEIYFKNANDIDSIDSHRSSYCLICFTFRLCLADFKLNWKPNTMHIFQFTNQITAPTRYAQHHKSQRSMFIALAIKLFNKIVSITRRKGGKKTWRNFFFCTLCIYSFKHLFAIAFVCKTRCVCVCH